jgi:hypothetical protein
MIHRRDPLPVLDPAELQLPPSPKVAEIRTSTYQNAVGEEGLEVLVLVDELSGEQEHDLTWTKPIHERIRNALFDAGEERFPLILFRKLSDEDAVHDEEEAGDDEDTPVAG